jgi:hypothetical protein
MQSCDSQKFAVVLMVPPEVVFTASVGMSYSRFGNRSRQAVIDSQITIEPPPAQAWTANRAAATETTFFMTIPLEKSGPDGTGSSYLCKPLHLVKRELQKPCYNPVDARAKQLTSTSRADLRRLLSLCVTTGTGRMRQSCGASWATR